MSKKIRRLSVVFACFLLIIAFHRFCDWKADGFSMSRVLRNTLSQEAGVALSLIPPQELDSIFNQKFRYLAKGKQSFVFVSEDEKYVIKLLNNQYQKRLSTLHLLPSWLAHDKIAYNQKKMALASESYQLAFSDLREETGVLLLHLHPTSSLNKKLTIVDKLQIEHKLDLDNTGFLLQKRATPAYTQLKEWLQKGEKDKAKHALSDILKLLVTRCKKGISDKDPLIRTNLGFIGEKPLLLDLGPFSKNPEIKKKELYAPEILKITTSLKEWLQKEDPSLAVYLEEELRRAL